MSVRDVVAGLALLAAFAACGLKDEEWGVYDPKPEDACVPKCRGADSRSESTWSDGELLTCTWRCTKKREWKSYTYERLTGDDCFALQSTYVSEGVCR